MSTSSIGPDLPFAATPSASVVGRTLADSVHQWRQDSSRLSDDAPNVVVFLTSAHFSQGMIGEFDVVAGS